MQLLREKYDAKINAPQADVFQALASQQNNELAYKVLNQMIENREGLSFENGRYKISTNNFIPIVRITVTRERIHVVVQGRAEVADLVVAEVAEFIWLAGGVTKTWEDIRPAVQLIAYGTGTIVNLGFPFEHLMNDRITRFIEEQMIGGKRYAADMGFVSQRRKSPTQPHMLYTLDEINILFHRFDLQTGRSEDSAFRLTVTDRDSRGTGVVLVTSELPFVEHVSCLQSLREAVMG